MLTDTLADFPEAFQNGILVKGGIAAMDQKVFRIIPAILPCGVYRIIDSVKEFLQGDQCGAVPRILHRYTWPDRHRQVWCRLNVSLLIRHIICAGLAPKYRIVENNCFPEWQRRDSGVARPVRAWRERMVAAEVGW